MAATAATLAAIVALPRRHPKDPLQAIVAETVRRGQVAQRAARVGGGVNALAGGMAPYVVARMTFFVGTKVRFVEKYRPPQVRWGAVGTIVDMEERAAPNSGLDYWVRARFGDFITPWIEAWQLERVS
jgi:hypothetical protein